MQAVASAILAPSLRHVADSLALHWRKQLTAVTHKRYLQRINFYTVSNLAGMQVRHQLLQLILLLYLSHLLGLEACHKAWQDLHTALNLSIRKAIDLYNGKTPVGAWLSMALAATIPGVFACPATE